MTFRDAIFRHAHSAAYLTRAWQLVDDRCRHFVADSDREIALLAGLALWRNWNVFFHIKEVPHLFGLPEDVLYLSDQQLADLPALDYDKCATVRAHTAGFQPVVFMESAVDFANELRGYILDMLARSDMIVKALTERENAPAPSDLARPALEEEDLTLESYLQCLKMLRSHAMFCSTQMQDLEKLRLICDAKMAVVLGVDHWRVKSTVIDVKHVCSALGFASEALILPEEQFQQAVEANFEARDAIAATMAARQNVHEVVFTVANMQYANEMITRIYQRVSRTFIDLWSVGRVLEQQSTGREPMQPQSAPHGA